CSRPLTTTATCAASARAHPDGHTRKREKAGMKNSGSARHAGARLGAAIVALGALMAGATAAIASTAPGVHRDSRLLVTTTAGTLRGKITGRMDEFLGIPYAAPPVGPLRWRPPHPAAPWTGIRAATAFAPHCPQPPSGFGVASTSENCLYLNVYTPAAARAGARDLPVMVWIHGGAFIAGESNDYNPAALVGHGVIVL